MDSRGILQNLRIVPIYLRLLDLCGPVSSASPKVRPIPHDDVGDDPALSRSRMDLVRLLMGVGSGPYQGAV